MDKKYLLAISAIAIIIMAYIFLVMENQFVPSAQYQENMSPMGSWEFSKNNPFPPHMPISFFLVIILFLLLPVILLYSNLQVERKLAASSELLSKLIDKHNNGSKRTQQRPSVGRELVARLLEPKEMAVIERLIEQPKGMPQSEIVKMPGMTKLKAHRIVEKLRQKGIITVQKDGKTNQIKLDNRTRSLLSGLE